MSKLRYLALSGAFALVAAVPVYAQPRPTVAPAGGGAIAVRPTQVTPGRVDIAPIRPHRDPPNHLQERLRNACFNSPNPPVEICRRYFGDQTRGRGG